MPNPVLDTIRDAELEVTADQMRYVRTGYVDDIDLAADNDPDALIKVLPYLPAFNSQLSGNAATMKLRRVRVRPQPEKFRRVNVELLYERGRGDINPTVYLLRDRMFTINKNDHMIPGLRDPMVLGFESENDNERGLSLPKKPMFLDMNMSARAIELTILRYGRPSGGAADYGNYVNDAPWPTGGVVIGSLAGAALPTENTATPLPKGYWRLASYSLEWNPNVGMALVKAEAVTKIIEDWSQFGMAQDRYGNFPYSSLSDANKSTINSLAKTPDYLHGPIYPVGAQKHKGLGRWGPYPLTGFPAIFTF